MNQKVPHKTADVNFLKGANVQFDHFKTTFDFYEDWTEDSMAEVKSEEYFNSVYGIFESYTPRNTVIVKATCADGNLILSINLDRKNSK